MSALVVGKPSSGAMLTGSSEQAVPGVPFARLIRVELRKQINTRAGRALLIIMAAVAVIVMIPLVLLDQASDKEFMGFALGALTPLMLLVPVIGIMAATGEWSQRTGMVTFALEPRRGRVIWAKLLSALWLGAVAFGTVLVFAALANLCAMVFRGSPGVWELDWTLVGGVCLMLMLLIAQGVAFGVLILNTPGALVSYYIVPTVWTIMLGLISWLAKSAEWLDLGAATLPLMTTEGLVGDDWAKLAVAAAVWIALPFALGTWRVLRREVK